MPSHKSRLAQATYRREVDSYRSTVADTAARIAGKMSKRLLKDRAGIQADIHLLENDLLWLGEHHLPRAYALGHGRLRDDPRAPGTIANALALNRTTITSKFTPAVRAATLDVSPNQTALDYLMDLLADEDIEQVEADLRKRNDAQSVALLAWLGTLQGIDDPAERRAAGLNALPLGLAVAGLAVTLGAWAASLGGRYWATIWQGMHDKVVTTRQGEPMPVKRVLNSDAAHCDTCPDKAGVYDSWDEMLSYCGGYPGDGSDICHSSCRCELFEWNGTTWEMT